MSAKEKHVRKAIALKMPPQFENACKDAINTRVLTLRKKQLSSKDLKKYIIPFAKENKITTLDLSDNSIGKRPDTLEETEAALKALVGIQSLRILILNGNYIGSTNAALLIAGKFTTLHVSDCGLGYQGAEELAKSTTIKNLDVSLNGIGNSGAQALLKNTSIKTLDMSHNEIHDEGFKDVNNTTLRTLNIDNNYISEQSASALVSMKLESLDITRNFGQFEIFHAFLNALRSGTNKTLYIFEFDISLHSVPLGTRLEMQTLLYNNAAKPIRTHLPENNVISIVLAYSMETPPILPNQKEKVSPKKQKI
jgi:Leucine Rich repeat